MNTIKDSKSVKRCMFSLGAAIAAALSLSAAAQTFPSKPLRIIIPVQPVGAVDVIPRMLAEKMAIDLG